MIAYFDTSAVVPLVIDEPTSHRCRRVWNEAARVVSTRLLYPEACAALARANRMERLTNANTAAAIALFPPIALPFQSRGPCRAATNLRMDRG